MIVLAILFTNVEQQLDYYGQAMGGGQQTNLAAAAQYNELANSPELAHLLQVPSASRAPQAHSNFVVARGLETGRPGHAIWDDGGANGILSYF
jgi:hypothetical protein